MVLELAIAGNKSKTDKKNLILSLINNVIYIAECSPTNNIRVFNQDSSP